MLAAGAVCSSRFRASEGMSAVTREQGELLPALTAGSPVAGGNQ